MKISTIFILLLFLLIIFLVLFYITRKKRKSGDLIKRDIVSLEEILIFFKKSEIKSILINNKNLSAVVLRENINDDIYKYKLTCTIFDKSIDKVYPHFEKDTLTYLTKELDENLKNMFGNNDVLILK